MLPTTSSDSSSSVPAATTFVANGTLQVPVVCNGNYSSDNLLGTTTPSDVSSANSPAMVPTTAAQPPDSTVEAFTLATSDTPVASGVSARARIVPESLLLPVEDDDDDDEFIPRGNESGPSWGITKPPHRPVKDGVATSSAGTTKKDGTKKPGSE